MFIYVDTQYDFFELFNPNNGTLVRSNIKNSLDNPIMRSFPELIDIGIMGHCDAGRDGICLNAGVDCYQEGPFSNSENMNLDDYRWIIEQCKGKVFQVALGGAGDPNKHNSFKEILEVTRENGIIPNLTTSGYKLLDSEIDLIKNNCGAVAVSFYSRLVQGIESNAITIDAISRFVKAKCITNIHFVVSNKTIDEAIERLKYNIFPQGINAIVFLLYKPVGLGKRQNVITMGQKLREFFHYAVEASHPFNIGFDTCFSPALFSLKTVSEQSIDSCEAARFSMYIDSSLMAYPCSFGIEQSQYMFQLKPSTILDCWTSDAFELFRNNTPIFCRQCKNNVSCKNGCNLGLNIELCRNM